MAIIRLDNGLRVLLQPVPGAQVVATCLHVATGSRAEPVAGAAHLLEHVLAQGPSGNGPLTASIAAMGGTMNARTAPDYTQYTQVLPSDGLELGLRVERDRLTEPDLSREHIRTQIAVVQAEIRRNVLSRPHGGLVLFDLPDLLHDDWANRHNGYGDITAIEALEPPVLRTVFDSGYAPGNIHLAVVGGFSAGHAAALADRLLGSVPARQTADPPIACERPLAEPRSAVRADAMATDARTTWGFRIPDPVEAPAEHLATVLLAEVLDAALGTWCDCHGACLAAPWGPFRARVSRTGNPFDVARSCLFAVECRHPTTVPPEEIEHCLRSLLGRIARGGPDAKTLDEALVAVRCQVGLHLHAELDSVASQASWLCIGAAIHGDPGYLARLPDMIEGVPAELVRRMAAGFAAAPAARITSVPEAVPGAVSGAVPVAGRREEHRPGARAFAPVPAIITGAAAGEALVPRFSAPRHQAAATERGTVLAVGTEQGGRLTEGRLVLALTPPLAPDDPRVAVLAEVLRTSLEETAGALAVTRVEARGDRVVISARALSEDFGQVAAWLGGCLESAGLLGEERVRRAAQAVATRLLASADRPSTVARDGFLAAVYGTGLPRTDSARQITSDRLRKVLEVIGCSAVAVGPGPAGKLLAAAAPMLPALGPASASRVLGPPEYPVARLRTAIRPGLGQALIRVGGLVPGRGHPDYPALQLAVLMLGGYFGSRLTLILREREGLTYAPRAVLDPVGDAAAFTVEADVRPDGAGRALTLIGDELGRLADGRFAAQELRSAQNFAVGVMAMACSSRSGTASVLAGILAAGLPASWLDRYEQRLREVTVQDVARAAERYLRAPGLSGMLVVPEPIPDPAALDLAGIPS